MDMAYRYLLEAEKYGNNHTLNYVWLSYYKYSKQYKLGIEMSNEIIKREFIKHNVKPYLEMLYYQADLYHKMSNYQTASQLYAKYITLNDSVMSAKFYNDLAKLRTQHDIDKFALKNKQMDLKAAKDHSQMIIMKDLTKKLKYQDGTDIANQCLAYFYVFSGFKVEAVKLYEEILQDMYKRNVPLRRRIYLLRQLLNNTEGEKHNYYVNILYDYIKECETKGIKKLDDTYTLEVMKVLYYNNKSNTAYKNKDANEMRHYITLSEQLIKQYNLIEEDDDITLLRFQYYYLCKNYSKALQEGEILLNSYKKKEELQKYMFVLNIKNDILYKTNKKDDALIGYKNYAALKDSFSCTEFYKYLASFRSQRDFDNLKLTNQALKIEASHDHFQMSMLRFSIGSLIFICLIMKSEHPLAPL